MSLHFRVSFPCLVFTQWGKKRLLFFTSKLLAFHLGQSWPAWSMLRTKLLMQTSAFRRELRERWGNPAADLLSMPFTLVNHTKCRNLKHKKIFKRLERPCGPSFLTAGTAKDDLRSRQPRFPPEPALLCQMSGLYDGFWGHQGPQFLKMFLSVPWDPPKGTLWSWNLLRSLSTRGSAARSAPSQADSVSRGRFSCGQQFKACSWSSVPDIRTLP